MRVLIAGGYGFLGGRLALHLAQAGHQVVLGTRKVEQAPVWLSQAEVVQLHWNEAKALEDVCGGVDVVIQAAGMNAQDCAADPVAALEFNGVATARLVEAASKAAVKRVLYFSTAHVYSSHLSGLIDEGTCPRNPHPYATSHLAGENAVLAFRREGEMQGIVLRLTNGFGAPVHRDANCWSLLINGLCRQTVEEGHMTLLSPGLQRRDFIAISAVCRSIEGIINRNVEAKIPNIINVGFGVSQSVREIAQLIQQRCQVVLGFSPHLTWPESADVERHLPLVYRSKGLEELNIAIQSANSTEVDDLLKFCASTFRKRPCGAPGIYEDMSLASMDKVSDQALLRSDTRPIVSVIIPTYNHARFLPSALNSVIGQTFASWEVIVVNNFSQDNTVELVESYRDPRIQLANFANHGVIAASRNHGIALTQAPFIAFLDSDDHWYPQKLQKCLDKLSEGYDLVCHAERWVGPANRTRDVFYGPEARASYDQLLYEGNCLSTSAIVVRRSLVEKAGGFSTEPEFITAEDYEFWLKLAQVGTRIGFFNDVLGEYLIHDGNQSGAVLRNMEAVRAVIRHHFADMPDAQRQTWRERRRLAIATYGGARGLQDSGQYGAAWQYFLEALRQYPLLPKAYVAMALNAMCKKL